jgi:hypothetical protein
MDSKSTILVGKIQCFVEFECGIDLVKNPNDAYICLNLIPTR